MQLSPADVQLFFKLQSDLNNFIYAQQCREEGNKPAGLFRELPLEVQLKVRQAFLDRSELLEQFMQQNPAQLPEDELAIVAGWKQRLCGRFTIVRYLERHAIFLSSTEPTMAFGVVGLTQPIDDVVGPTVPVMVDAVLLPFRDQITYDGVLNRLSISFGPGLRKSMNESYRIAKEQFGIVTSLPFTANQAPNISPNAAVANPPKKKAAKKASKVASSPADKSKQALEDVIALIDSFCRTHLNEDCADLCRKLAEKLARKRPSPLASGKPAAWAAGIVRAIAYINFLDDPSQQPHIKPSAIDAGFGISESTGQSKSLLIRKTLRIHRFEPAWTLASRLDANPFVWMLEVNGFLVDIRTLPREAQEIAFEEGLIPYIPADQISAGDAASDTSLTDKVFQFRVTLERSNPPIWRRIQVPDGTLDDLHGHIQTAMGWTNSHLHQFLINEQCYGDPDLLNDDDLSVPPFVDSTQTLISEVMPSDGSRPTFRYEYDFGDGWEHTITFEGSTPPEPGVKYPHCLEGERACPPEDVGGLPGFEQFKEAMANPKHPDHASIKQWYGRPFRPDDFDPKAATKAMQKGLPDWRSMKNR